MQWRDLVSWSATIRAYAARGHAEMAFELFAEMQSKGVRLNTSTFTSVLAACSCSGLVDEDMKHLPLLSSIVHEWWISWVVLIDFYILESRTSFELGVE